jgi:hypothetical protein
VACPVDRGKSITIALETLQRPHHEGGLSLLNIKAYNEAIELIWLKKYLNFTQSCQEWVEIMDIIIATSALKRIRKKVRRNPFLQCWEAPLKGLRANLLNDDIR